jgi:hypothetical protein
VSTLSCRPAPTCCAVSVPPANASPAPKPITRNSAGKLTATVATAEASTTSRPRLRQSVGTLSEELFQRRSARPAERARPLLIVQGRVCGGPALLSSRSSSCGTSLFHSSNFASSLSDSYGDGAILLDYQRCCSFSSLLGLTRAAVLIYFLIDALRNVLRDVAGQVQAIGIASLTLLDVFLQNDRSV